MIRIELYFGGLPSNLVMRNTSGKSQLRGILLNTSLVFFRTVKVSKSKKSLNKCHSQEEHKDTWQLDVMISWIELWNHKRAARKNRKSVELMDLLIIMHCCCCCEVASVVSDSVQPHRWQPTRLPRPWDSPRTLEWVAISLSNARETRNRSFHFLTKGS